ETTKLAAGRHLEWRPAVRALLAGQDAHRRLAHRAEHVHRIRHLILGQLGLPLGGHLTQVEGGGPAVQAEVPGLHDAVRLVRPLRVDLHLGEERPEELRAAAVRAGQPHSPSLPAVPDSSRARPRARPLPAAGAGHRHPLDPARGPAPAAALPPPTLQIGHGAGRHLPGRLDLHPAVLSGQSLGRVGAGRAGGVAGPGLPGPGPRPRISGNAYATRLRSVAPAAATSSTVNPSTTPRSSCTEAHARSAPLIITSRSPLTA